MSRQPVDRHTSLSTPKAKSDESELYDDCQASSYVKQCIKVQNLSDDNRRCGKFFTIAHLYLTSAAFARENSKVTLPETCEKNKMEPPSKKSVLQDKLK